MCLTDKLKDILKELFVLILKNKKCMFLFFGIMILFNILGIVTLLLL